MAISVMNWVWDHSRTRHGSRLVLLAIADCAREDGTAWPSVPELKRKTGLGERAVQAAIIDCAKLGELEVGYQRGPKGCNRYIVTMRTTPADIAGAQNLRGAESAPPQELRGSESPQVSGQDPADIAPPAESAPPQISTGNPADSAGGTVIEPPLNSPTESSVTEGGAGGAALFDAKPAAQPRPRRKSTKRTGPGPEFERWYAAYPVHKARGEAAKAWVQVVAGGADPEVLIAAAQSYSRDPQVLRGWGKHPATWLRAECWLDEPSAPPSDTPPGVNGYANGHRPSTADLRVAEAQALKERRRQRREQGDAQGDLPPNTVPGEVVR